LKQLDKFLLRMRHQPNTIRIMSRKSVGMPRGSSTGTGARTGARTRGAITGTGTGVDTVGLRKRGRVGSRITTGLGGWISMGIGSGIRFTPIAASVATVSGSKRARSTSRIAWRI